MVVRHTLCVVRKNKVRRRTLFRFWLISVIGLLAGAVAPSVCAVACGQGLCGAQAPVEAKASCCHPKTKPDKCPKCGAQAEISAKKGQSVPSAAKVWDAPVDPFALLPATVVEVQGPTELRQAPVASVQDRAPPDPSVGPCSPRAPPMSVV